MNAQGSPRDGGFALIEAICVLLVSALIMATLSLATSVVIRNSEVTNARSNELEVLASGIARLRQDVSGIIAVRTGPEKDSPLLFSGGRNSIIFAVGADGERPEMMVWIESHYRSGIGTLLRWETPLLPGDPTRAILHRQQPDILISGPWIFRFAFGHDGTDDRSLWDTGWSGRKTLPSLVRLDIGSAKSHGAVTSVVAATHVDAVFDCITSEGICSGEDFAQQDGGDDAG